MNKHDFKSFVHFEKHNILDCLLERKVCFFYFLLNTNFFIYCILPLTGELDDNLMPTGKEAVKSDDFLLDDMDECVKKEDLFLKQEKTDETLKKDDETRKVARPGTTKRRMYYFKKVSYIFISLF